MEITEVRIKLMEDTSDRLKAFCSVTFDDCFVIRDLKIIEGTNGPFVAMPSRKLTSHCSECRYKNHLRAAYCNQCGSRQPTDRAVTDDSGRTKLFADIAHPINSTCRESIQNRILMSYKAEKEASLQPGYVSRYEDYDFDTTDIPDPAPSPTPSTSGPRVESAETGPKGPHTARPPERAPRGAFGEGIF